MRAVAQRILFVLLNGCMIVVGSEMLFWARPLAAVTWPGVVGTVLFYSWNVYLLLAAVAYFRVANFWQLFLVGAIFGWLTEGVLVQTMYAALPLSISFTGLAWHALLVVCVLWAGLQQRLRSGSWWRLIWSCGVIGLCYGFWSVTWWTEPGLAPTPIHTFATYSFATIGFFGIAAWSASRVAPRAFAPGRWEIIILSGGEILYFVFVTVPAAPIAVAILPPLLAITLLSLWRNRRITTQPHMLESFATTRVSLLRLPLLLLIPVVATLVYALFDAGHLNVQTSIVLYLITVPLGFICYIWGCVQSLRASAAKPAVTGEF